MWNMRPGVATSYLIKVVHDFEEYAKKNYPGFLTQSKVEDADLLAALRYIETRQITGHQHKIQELLSVKRKGKLAKEIGQACLDALLATAEDTPLAIHHIVHVATLSKPVTASKLCEKSLKQFGTTANAIILEELGKTTNAIKRRELALLLVRVSGVGMPRRLRFWRTASPEEVLLAVKEWKKNYDRKKLSPYRLTRVHYRNPSRSTQSGWQLTRYRILQTKIRALTPKRTIPPSRSLNR